MKTIFFSLLFAISLVANAQFSIDTTGHTIINSNNGKTLATFSDSIGLMSFTQANLFKRKQVTSVFGKVDNCKTDQSCGVMGISVNTNYGNFPSFSRSNAKSYGVYGYSEHGKSGCNYGVFGAIPNINYGAAIYGTTSMDSGLALDNSYAGYFDGKVKIKGYLTVSDALYCDNFFAVAADTTHNIEFLSLNDDITSELEKLSTIIPQTYISYTNKNETSKHYTFSAEQVKQVYPELIVENERGRKYINYIDVIPILVKCISELKAELENLKAKQNINGNAMTRQSYTNISDIKSSDDSTNTLMIGQNCPNPWNFKTTIDLYIPDDARNVIFIVYDIKGQIVYTQPILSRGYTTVTLNNYLFNRGTYLYTINIDNQILESKKMVLIK